METPVKFRLVNDNGSDSSELKGTPLIGVSTPSGGVIYNPFYKEYVNRLQRFTVVSPGVFSSDALSFNRVAAGSTEIHNEHDDGTRPWSPELKGELFPEDIDENPVLQMKLQETLDSQDDELAQSLISGFFRNNLVAPSPDTLPPSTAAAAVTPLKSGKVVQQNRRLELRGASMPETTPKGRSSRQEANVVTVSMVDAEIQTSISLDPTFDLLSLLTQHQQQQQQVSIRLDACRVHRSNPYPHRAIAFCPGCQQRHEINRYFGGRSLFLESTNLNGMPGDRAASLSTTGSTTDSCYGDLCGAEKSRSGSGHDACPPRTPPVTPRTSIAQALAATPLAPLWRPDPTCYFNLVPMSPVIHGRTSPTVDRERSSAQHEGSAPPSPDLSPIGSPKEMDWAANSSRMSV